MEEPAPHAFDVERVFEELKGDPAWEAGSFAGRTLGTAGALRVGVLAMRAGATYSSVARERGGVVHVVAGRVRLGGTAGGQAAGAGAVVILRPRERHSLEALEDTCLLLTEQV